MSTRRIRLDLTRSLASLVMLANLFFFCSSYAQAGQVTLAWDASTSSGVAGYQINYGQTSGSYATQVDVSNQTSYTVTGLNDGAIYYFAAKAYNSGKTTWSGFSNQVSATIPSPPTAPTAGFNANPASGTAPLTVTFTDTSTGNITSRSWDFGDCSTNPSNCTSTATSGTKTYSTPGTYTMRLTVTGSGVSNTAMKIISATAAPAVANFSATPTIGTAPLAVNFTNSSTGSVTSYSWNFGDCSTNPNNCTSTLTNPARTYSTAGTYTVSLTATGASGTNPSTKTLTSYITVSSSSGGGGGNNAGLVGAYNFEEASGTTVVDASGRGNTGTISGATRITQGRSGKALSFDGVNDWVTINDATPLDLTTKTTLEAWVYPTAVPSGWSTIMHKEVDRYFLMAGSDQGRPATGGTYSTGMKILYAPAPLVANTWNHLATTYDGTTIRLYVNGNNVASQVPNAPLTVSASALRIGGTATYGEFFKGRIDELRIYNRALSATEIQADMNGSVATSSPPVTLAGTKTIGPVVDSNPQGKAEAFQTTAAVTGMVTGLSVYVDSSSTATQLVAGLYTDTNGHPGTRLAQGTLTSPKAGSWNTVALPAKSLTAGSKYWIAILGPSGVLQFRDAASSTSQPSETSAQSTLTTLPSTWSTGSPSYQGSVSAYGAGY